MKVYLAGKITGSDWRHQLFDSEWRGVPSHQLFKREDWDVLRSPAYADDGDELSCKWPVLKKAISGGFDYVGPYYVNPWGGHGPYLEAGFHGNDPEGYSLIQDIAWNHAGDNVFVQSSVRRLCLDAIQKADVVFAWIDRPDVYGTLVEIGYAHGIGKPVWIGLGDFNEYLGTNGAKEAWEAAEELWFACNLDRCIPADSPLDAWHECLLRYQPSLLKHIPYREYLKSAHWEETRKKALDRARHRCQACNSPDDLHVHHRTYERRGEERDDDLTVLCRSCHSRVHDIKNGRVTRMPVKV